MLKVQIWVNPHEIFSCHLDLQIKVAWMQICLSDFVGGRMRVTEEGWVQACPFSGICCVIMKPLVSETGYGVSFSVPTVLSKLWQKQLLLEFAQRMIFPPTIDNSPWGDVSITRALCLAARVVYFIVPLSWIMGTSYHISKYKAFVLNTKFIHEFTSKIADIFTPT